MTEQELEEYLKKNLKVKVSTEEYELVYSYYERRIVVELLLNNKVISKSSEVIERISYES